MHTCQVHIYGYTLSTRVRVITRVCIYLQTHSTSYTTRHTGILCWACMLSQACACHIHVCISRGHAIQNVHI